jgi:hypothetical protein
VGFSAIGAAMTRLPSVSLKCLTPNLAGTPNLRMTDKHTSDILKVGTLHTINLAKLTNSPINFYSFMLSITSICISRVMLGIRSLAAELISDPALLLNSAELSRVCLKKGPNAGEFIVDIQGDDKSTFGVIDIRRETQHEFDTKSESDISSLAVQMFRISSPV